MANYSQTTAEADARLIGYTGSPDKASDATDAGAVLRRGWFYLAGQAASGNTVQELIVALQGVATYTDPKANNKPYTGTWVNSEVQSSDENSEGTSDRATHILQTLTRVLSPTTAAHLGDISPKILQTNEILDIFAVNEGERDLVALSWENINPSSRSSLMALADADLENIANSYITSCSYDQRKWEEQTNKTGVFSILCRKTTFVNENFSPYYVRWTPNIGRMEESEIATWPNLTANAATTIYDDAKTNEDNMVASAYLPAPTGHKLKTVEKRHDGEGGYSIVRTTYKPASSTNLQWPPGQDETNCFFAFRRYRKYTDSTSHTISQVRIWTFERRQKYASSLTEAQNFINDWTGSVYSTYGYPTKVNYEQRDADGLKWVATFEYLYDDSGWDTDTKA